MKIARMLSRIILAATVWRLIVLRREALARERRARKLAPLLITAAGTGVILAARPLILEGARRLLGGPKSQLAVEMAPRRKVRRSTKRASSARRTPRERAAANPEPKPT